MKLSSETMSQNKGSLMIVQQHNRSKKVVGWILIVVRQNNSGNLQGFVNKESSLSIVTTTTVWFDKEEIYFYVNFKSKGQHNVLFHGVVTNYSGCCLYA